MKKTNRSLRLCLFLSLILVFSGVVGTEVTHASDTAAPVLNSLTILNPDSIDATGSMTVVVDVTEDGVGANYLSLVFRNDSGHLASVIWEGQNMGDGTDPRIGTETRTLLIPINNALTMGDYSLDKVEIHDRDANGSAYQNDSLAEICTTRNITVVKSELTDITAPIVSSLSIHDPAAIDATGNMTVDIDITEDGVGASMLDLYFVNELGHRALVRWEAKGFGNGTDPPMKTGQQTLHIPINSSLGLGHYVLQGVNICDGNMNSNIYEKHDLGTPLFDCEINVVKTDLADTTGAVINGLSFAVHSLTTPTVLEVNLDLVEESGLGVLDLYFENAEGHRMELCWSAAGWNNGTEPPLKTGMHTVRIPVSPFAGNGTYFLKEIYTYDMCSNYARYSAADLNLSPAGRMLTVTSTFDIAAFATLGNTSNILATINDMSHGQTLVLDCRDNKLAPKEIFEAIAETDKTLVFQDEDVQWVFKGTEIKMSRCKDIDLTTDISLQDASGQGFPDEEDNKVLVIAFIDNGLLPGEADVRINDAYISTRYAGGNGQFILSYISADLPEVEDENVEVEEDEAAILEIDHNSSFVLSGTVPRYQALSQALLKRSSYTYTGNAIKPSLIVTAEKATVPNNGYTLACKNNKNVGTASATITGAGMFKGKLTQSYTIIPKGARISKISKAKKGFTVKWKKQAAKMSKTRISGYEIRYSLNSNMSAAKKVTVKGYKKTSKKIKKLKAKKKYYVQIRTYMKVNGKIYYSEWSSKKPAKTK